MLCLIRNFDAIGFRATLNSLCAEPVLVATLDCRKNGEIKTLDKTADLGLHFIMESQWIKADFKTVSQWRGAYADQLRLVNETLARDLSMNLSAFLRSSVNVAFTGASNAVFSEFLNDDERSCFAAVLTKQHERKLLVRADYDVLFPLIGIALGAQAGGFVSPSRKPTEIELQVVTLLFRLILSEVFRAWSPLTGTQLEALTVEVEPAPSRVLPGTELTCSVGFEIRV